MFDPELIRHEVVVTRAARQVFEVRGMVQMPELSRFFGIVIRMYFNDHTPAHFHAEYGEYEALIEIDSLAILRGELPRRALALVLEWSVLHRQELGSAWQNARVGMSLGRIAPLE